MDNVTTIRLDIAKSVFQVHGGDAAGVVAVHRTLTRGRVLAFFERLPDAWSGSRPAARRTIGHASSSHVVIMCGCYRHSM